MNQDNLEFLKKEKVLHITEEVMRLGGRIYFPAVITVDYTISHGNAVKRAAPETSIEDIYIYEIGEKYEYDEVKSIKKEMVLIKFPVNSNRNDCINLAIAMGLTRSTPLDIFALAAKNPNLNAELDKLDSLFLSETTGCVYRDYPSSCGVLYINEARWAGVNHDVRLSGGGDYLACIL